MIIYTIGCGSNWVLRIQNGSNWVTNSVFHPLSAVMLVMSYLIVILAFFEKKDTFSNFKFKIPFHDFKSNWVRSVIFVIILIILVCISLLWFFVEINANGTPSILCSIFHTIISHLLIIYVLILIRSLFVDYLGVSVDKSGNLQNMTSFLLVLSSIYLYFMLFLGFVNDGISM